MSQHSFVEANVHAMVEICLNSDLDHLEQYVNNNFGQGFGLDFCLDDQKQTLLHILAGNLQFEYWDTILRCFVYVNSPDANQHTPLHIAVSKRNIKAIRALVAAGASMTNEDEHGVNPFQLACKSDFKDGLEVFLSTPTGMRYLKSNFTSNACLCIDNNSIECFKTIIRSVPEAKLNELNEDGNALIHYAAQSKSKKFLRALLDLKVDINLPNKSGSTPIECATKEKSAVLLYIKGANIPKVQNNKKLPPIIESITKESNWQSTGECFTPCELHKFAMEGNAQGILSLNSKKVDIIDCFSYSPLMYAVEYFKDPTAISALLKQGADPNFPSTKSKSNLTNAYHLAALKGNAVAILEFKKKFAPNFSYLDKKGRNLILCSILSKDITTINEIVLAAPNIDGPFDQIIKALLSIENDSTLAEVTKILISKGLPAKSVDEHEKSLIMYGIETGKSKFVEVLLNNGALTELEADDAIITAVKNDQPDIVISLLSSTNPLQLNVNPLIMHQGLPLIFYTINKSMDILKVLFTSNQTIKTQIDTKGNTFLHRAAYLGNLECIKYAIEVMKIDVNIINNQGETPLHKLMHDLSNNFENNYKYLVEKGANIKQLDNSGNNILHFAAENNNKDALSILLGLENVNEPILSENDINEMIQQQNNDERIPLEVASKHLSDLKSAFAMNKKWQLKIFDGPITDETFQEFAQKNLSPNVKNMKGTPLITYVMDNCENKDSIVGYVQNLLLFGADPSSQDTEELTPLHHAIALKNNELAKILIDEGSSFIIGPIIRVYAEENGTPEMLDLIKQPEKRASAVDEFLQTQINAVDTMAAILKFKNRFNRPNEDLTIRFYMDEVSKMHRLLSLFVDRLRKISHNMKPSAEFGNFFMYFVDAFIPLLNIPTVYHTALSEIQQIPELAQILTESVGFNNYNLADTLIVPVQQFTRYHELIRAIIKATPPDHPDIAQLQRAHLKYNNLGRASNERMLIAESREKLKTITLKSTVNDKMSQYNPNDVLLYHGLFEKKSPQLPPEGTKVSESYEWGLKTNQIQSGKINVQYYTTFGKSLKSFMKSQKIGIFLFSKIALFGLQKNEELFKIKFSCHSSEILWDFSKSLGPDTFQIWTPIGQFVLKIEPPKNSTADFEKTQWKNNVAKLSKIDESEMSTVNGKEICYVSWAGKETHCVHSKLFMVHCADKEEAKKKILEKLEQLGTPIETIPNPMGGTEPLVSFWFQTHCPPQGQDTDILSDVNLL
ncbi:ankyrin repeat protein [Histomonas meleagridis]|uniref:ankyrin repeat protein n=1 Tax=Histomonas meleagridis TaxID=135588 RepID=UPI00355A412F|nr:ankyrin repeat protein [Histomonas meleagridis]